MNILGFDTSTRAASVALIIDETLVGEITINDKRTHSQKLMPMLESMMNLANVDMNDIDALAVCVGPGSFTGIRIAMSTVKAIAHVRDIPVIAVNSLENISYNMDESDKRIVPIIGAQGSNVYTIIDEDIEVIDVEELLDSLKGIEDRIVVVGEAVDKYREKFLEKNIEIARFDRNVSRAYSICMLALDKYKKGVDVYNCYNILPKYIRKSQAEIQYEEKQKRLKENDL